MCLCSSFVPYLCPKAKTTKWNNTLHTMPPHHYFRMTLNEKFPIFTREIFSLPFICHNVLKITILYPSIITSMKDESTLKGHIVLIYFFYFFFLHVFSCYALFCLFFYSIFFIFTLLLFKKVGFNVIYKLTVLKPGRRIKTH